jgi:peptidoglycan-associated lipoprotein
LHPVVTSSSQLAVSLSPFHLATRSVKNTVVSIKARNQGVILAVLVSVFLSACASSQKADLSSKHTFEPGPLKVHPGLLGMTVATAPEAVKPPEVAKPVVVAVAPAVEPSEPVTATDPALRPAGMGVSRDLTAHLRSERSFYFDLDKSDLKADYDPVLKAHARYLADNPSARVRLEGHADERGGREYNRLLGLKRAEIVRSALLQRGAPAKQVGVKSYGELKPKLKGRNEVSWAENRRTDVIYEAE